MSDIKKFKGKHAGETMLIVGNGANLKLTPPQWFHYPSIGTNTIHFYEGWSPDYYTAVDTRLPREFGAEIVKKFADIPKFIPPKLMFWQEYYHTNHFYYFNIRPGVLWSLNDVGTIWQNDIEREMTFGNIMHVAIKLCWYMGAAKILIIGMEHKPQNGRTHFWGRDGDNGVDETPLRDWFEGYKQLHGALAFRGIEMLNLSPETYVPEEIIPRADWRQYAHIQE